MYFVPYLNFQGNCREAFEFYEKTLRGRITGLMTWGESPMGGDTPAEMRDRVLNVELKVGQQSIMASDSPPDRFEPASGVWVCIVNDDLAEAERIFRAFEDGGTVVMPFQPTFWAKGFGMVRDRFGTPWMVNSGSPEQE